jgi:CBS domain-containing protein
MPIRNIARPEDELVTAQPETSVRVLAERMRDATVGSVLVERTVEAADEMVMTDRGPRPASSVGSATEQRTELAGIVTDRDLAMKVLAAGEDPDALTAEDVMTPDPVTATADANVFTLCSKMRQHGVRRVPITDDGELCGIIAVDDLIWLIEDEIDNLEKITNDVAAVIESESPPYLGS